MAKNVIGAAPFSPVITIDKNGLFTSDDLNNVLLQCPDGASICIRYEDGPAKRGGYFFHFKSNQKAGEISLYDFEKRLMDNFLPENLVAFINHCSGRQFDENSFLLCQSKINFQKDE